MREYMNGKVHPRRGCDKDPDSAQERCYYTRLQVISMLRLHDDGYEFDTNKDRCIITKQDDKQVRIELRPGQKGAYYLHGQTITSLGGSNANKSAFPLDDEIWRTINQPINQEGHNIKKPHSVPKTLDINKLHDMLGHKGEGLQRKTCKHLGIKVTGELKACEACGIAKAKQRSLSKATSNKAKKPGQRLFFDTAAPFEPTINKNVYIFCITDDYSKFSCVYFGKLKSQIGKCVKDLIIHLTALKYQGEYLRSDPVGENKALKDFCKEQGIVLEKTAANKPQQNGVVERRLTVMIQRAHAQMRAANFNDEAGNDEAGNDEAGNLLWAESVNTANDISVQTH
jgi:hypothetical protein